jgi:phosphatidylglycerophosphatase A
VSATVVDRMITTFGLGHCRPASGTWGSIPPCVLAAALAAASLGAGSVSPGNLGAGTPAWVGVLLLVTLVFSAACIAGADRAEARWGKDPSPVVADETAGMALTLALCPPALTAGSWWQVGLWIAGAFVAFRIADIVKPWPAGAMQKIPGGWGILLDDLLAAGFAAGAVWGATLLASAAL